MESILPRVAFFYVMQDAGVLRARRRLAAVAVLQREVAVPTGRRLAVLVLVLVIAAAI